MPTGATPTESTESPAETGTGSISGAVWHDLCAVPDGPLPNPLPIGCTPTGDGGVIANGNREADEPGIPDVVVDLHAGECSDPTTTSISTDANGTYSFPALAAGDYCIAVDLANPINQKVLIPGSWSHPTTVTSVVFLSETIDNGEALTGMNFGWDYQFLPEIGAPAFTVTSDPLVAAATTTPTSAPQGTVFIVDTAANCRFGPGTAYQIITSYPIGSQLSIIGRNNNSTWWLIQVSSSQSCWISSVTGHTSGDTSSVPTVAAPPLPPTATPTPIPASSGDTTPPTLSGPIVVYNALDYPTSNCGPNLFNVAIRAYDDNLDSVWLRYRVIGTGAPGSWNTLTPNDNASGGLFGFNYDLNAQFAGELGGADGSIQYQFFAKDRAGNQAEFPTGSVLSIPLTYCP
jgi:hypothetical protein